MVISQGDVSQVGQRLHVVVQNNFLNRKRISTVLVCGLTLDVRRASDRGNVLLTRGEANLPRSSVANVSQILTLDKSQLGKRSGALSPERVREIVAGVAFVIEPREPSPAGPTP